MRRFSLILPLCLLSFAVAASAGAQEKRQLTHDDYERWRTTGDESLSNDGAWAVWREAPDTVGDGRVVVRSTDGAAMHVIERGDSPAFSADGGFVVVMVHPPYDSTRQAKIDGKSEDDLPQDSLVVLDLSDGSRTGWADVDSYRLPEDGGAWVAILQNEVPADSAAAEVTADSTETEGPDHEKTDGAPLILYRMDSGESWTFDRARSYVVTDDGGWLVYTAESKDGQADGAFAVNAVTGEATTLLSGAGYYRHPVVDDDGVQVAFLSNTGDFEAEQPSFTLYRADLGGPGAQAVVYEGHDALPDGWWVSGHRAPEFSEAGDRLFFGSAPRPDPEPDDEIPDDEKVPVDVWSWDDDYLMTVQLENRQEELERSYLAAVHLGDGRVVQLADKQMPDIDLIADGDADTFIGTSNIRYRQDREWDYPWPEDVYTVDAQSGQRRLILERVNGSVMPSPDGSRIAWWDRDDRAWKITTWGTEPADHTLTATITSGMEVPVHNVEHDWPYAPNPYGAAGWTEDGSMFVFYDEFDMWGWRTQSGPDSSSDGDLVAITAPHGRNDSLRYRWIRTDDEPDGIPVDTPQLLSLFNERTKASGFAEWRISRSMSDVEEIILDDLNFGFEGKADDDAQVLFTRESYEIFPDLWTASSWREMPNATRLSDVNPHQDEYAWGTVELVHWTSTDGERLDGLLYKPEGFDPSQQYPLMTYFYETSSDGLHGYHVPAPGRSVINRTFYTSRGYVVFVPDIPYKIGYPGESAMNAVMPGVTHLIDQGFIDRERVGVQGHSWGGYQIAYMVTRTNLFAAAEAGAPVSNMLSAYGGIRWETGLSRQFQYERTQSRIGGSIWEKPLRYIENSPIFWLDKVETPLLIMHNDADGHVPWYQGIELFVGLRRLDKPAWFINYNDEPHWPLPYFKRLDWTTRLQQFFDHYLMDAPAPVWLEEGVPAVDKGRTRGLELVEPADGG